MKYGCCANIDRYNDLVGLGYDFIELAGTDIYNMSDLQFNNVRSIIKNGPIGCTRVNAFMQSDIKVVGHDIDWERIREYVEKVSYRAGLLGVETIGFGSPMSRNIPDGFSREKAVEQAVEFAKFAADRSSQYGIKILVEAVTKSMTNFINTLDEALHIVKQVNCQYVALLIDLYHFWMEKESLESINAEAVKYLKHVHIAEENGRIFPVPCGIEKYQIYINRIKELGYNGTISIEADCVDFKKDAETSIDIFRKIG